MQPGEELMLLLELNGFDVKKYRLKKQFEFGKHSGSKIHEQKTLKDLFITQYIRKEHPDIFHRNPLYFNPSLHKTSISIDQFYVIHPDLLDNVTLKDVIVSKEFNDVHKESVIYDILDDWIEDYRENTIIRMEHLQELLSLLPRKNKKYKKPRIFPLITSLLLAFITIMIFMNPSYFQISILSFVNSYVNNITPHMIENWWFSLLGSLSIYMLLIYAISNIFFRRYLKEIRSEKNKYATSLFDKWKKDMESLRLEQAGILEDYVDQVLKNPSKSMLDITLLSAPEKLMGKLTNYVILVHKKYDYMTKHYRTFRKVLRLWFVFSLLINILFYIIGLAFIRGWIGV
jgi:hypothetical protein